MPSAPPSARSSAAVCGDARAVQLAGQVEQHGQRQRRVEVVVHRRAERARPAAATSRAAALARRHAVERGVQAPQRAARVVEVRVAEVERAAVVRAQHEEAQRLAVVALAARRGW